MLNISKSKQFPSRGYYGIILIIIFWSLNWSLNGLRTHWAFFPLWLGYILLADSLVFLRKGNSIFSRSKKIFIELFIFSIPVWWLFEILNHFTKNWFYVGREYFSDTQFFLLASLSFSTVIPAVFETAELVSSFRRNKSKSYKKIVLTKRSSLYLILAGIITLSAVILLPEYFYFLIWVSLYLLIDPINYLLGSKNLFQYLAQGNWKPVSSLITGCLICGFFWEMWNYFSYPKWIYFLPGVNFLHIFEMPALGYLGYIPFSLELFAIYNFIDGTLLKRKTEIIIF